MYTATVYHMNAKWNSKIKLHCFTKKFEHLLLIHPNNWKFWVLAKINFVFSLYNYRDLSKVHTLHF